MSKRHPIISRPVGDREMSLRYRSGPMSAMGHKRTFCAAEALSAFPPKADSIECAVGCPLRSIMAKSRIETDIDINAPASQVWALLTDFARMPSWNPFIKSISGNLVQGARLAVHIAPRARPECNLSRPFFQFGPSATRWLGHLLVPGIFDGEHYLSARNPSEKIEHA